MKKVKIECLPVWLHHLLRTNDLKIAYHEAGHCIVAAIFADKLYLKQITVNRRVLAQNDQFWNGALLIEWYETPQSHELEPGDHIICVALAGMCAQTLFSKGKKFVRSNRMLFPNKPSLMDTRGADIDYNIAKTYSVPIASNIAGISSAVIEWSAIRWIYDYLLEDEVWRGTKLLAEQLLRKQNKSLNAEEISEFLDKIGFTDHLLSHRKRYIEARYPFTKIKLRV